MPLAQLMTPDRLAERLDQPGLVVLDCRFALDDPDYGRRSHAQGHIPGAVFADLEQDLSAPVKPGITGRHPLPDPHALQATLRRWGIDQGSQIVFYDDGPGAFAARAWWLLLWLGKRDGLYLLDGGFKAWCEAGLPVDAQTPESGAGQFTGRPDPDLLIDADTLARRLDDQQLALLDARALPRYLGEVEPIDPVAGHIPGASCMPFTDNLDANGRFLPPERLRQRFEAVLADKPAQQTVVYCGSGVTACHNAFAISLAGLGLPRLYAGSWSEWITNPQRPIA
ncbi:sulfurtransferase [Stutzerimonas nosocomialis]|uniref:Sulfurtransferase n=1 Tax=Stutzerimonas nosocomialis TaxID=1056496 RepID=A0A5R9QCY2_9GAMM|nr:sulfurtransferase [Stutzerimonas nosocomialis]TLX60437.1 sulfurtransferase [Stutzerimonas nosocomialis]TLX62987.1 sulfurtransferase [Stutzerimonas nosocomialis]